MRWSSSTACAVVFCLVVTVAASAQQTDWVARYEGPGATSDIALAMAAADDGSTYVAGYSYDATGDDFVRLVKFADDGAVLWTQEFDGGFGWDDARDMAIGPDGSVTIAGFTTTADGRDVLVIRYDTGGAKLWQTTWTGPGRDDGKAVDVDADGNVYVAAESDGPDLSDDYATIKFDADGNLLWDRRYAGTGGWNDEPTDIAVTSGGIATVTGTARDASFDLVTIQYDPDGTERWVDAYDPLGYSYELGTAVEVDSRGRAFACGIELTASGTDDMVVIRYEPDGARGWVYVFDGDPDTYDDARAIAVAANGTVAVTGCSTVDTNDPDIRTLAFDANGTLLWSDRYSGPRLRGDDCGRAIAITAGSEVAVAGDSVGVSSGDDFVTLRYSSLGERLWAARYDGTGSGTDEPTGIAFASDGAVVVAGPSAGKDGPDFVAVRYTGTDVDPGCGVAAGAEPAGLVALFVLLAAGLVVRRRRDQAKSTD